LGSKTKVACGIHPSSGESWKSTLRFLLYQYGDLSGTASFLFTRARTALTQHAAGSGAPARAALRECRYHTGVRATFLSRRLHHLHLFVCVPANLPVTLIFLNRFLVHLHCGSSSGIRCRFSHRDNILEAGGALAYEGFHGSTVRDRVRVGVRVRARVGLGIGLG